MFKTIEAGFVLITVAFSVNPFVLCTKPHSFIHSFILDISIAPLPVHYYTQRRSRLHHSHCAFNLTRQNTTALPVKKVLTWRLEWGLNMLPSGRKASNIPLSYHAPHEMFMDNGALYIVYFTWCLCLCQS